MDLVGIEPTTSSMPFVRAAVSYCNYVEWWERKALNSTENAGRKGFGTHGSTLVLIVQHTAVAEEALIGLEAGWI